MTIKWDPYCECGTKKERNETYHAYYCAKCDRWLEKQCDDKDCKDCAGRPPHPSDIKNGEKSK